MTEMRRNCILGAVILLLGLPLKGQEYKKVIFDFAHPQQTIHSFGASDCWRTQYIGKNWPLEKRERIADLLFNATPDEQGNPTGIGLSLWRFNIGSGSHEAGDAGGVKPLWRRTECFLDKEGHWDWSKQAGQRWFLEAARKRKVPYALGFSITAPYFLTKNGMARASEKTKYANIREDAYETYASFLAEVSGKLNLDYLSPVNEPQWEWVRSNQEGMQATNEECCKLIHHIDAQLKKRAAGTKIIFGEAGDIRYLYRKNTDRPDRDNQINEMFASSGKWSISGLSSVAPIVTGHSYWSTWPLDTLIATRRQLKAEIEEHLPIGYAYWQTEYCPMEKNPDNPQGGGGRDLGMNTALYISRVIHHDLVVANASSWQSWTAFSEWNYKDGLIFIDDGTLETGASKGNEAMIETCKYDGTFRASKTLWTLGNYSYFVRPGMVRIGGSCDTDAACLVEDATGMLASAYADFKRNKWVIVLVNYGRSDVRTDVSARSLPGGFSGKRFKMYRTSEESDLKYEGVVSNRLLIPARSVITLESF